MGNPSETESCARNETAISAPQLPHNMPPTDTPNQAPLDSAIGDAEENNGVAGGNDSTARDKHNDKDTATKARQQVTDPIDLSCSICQDTMDETENNEDLKSKEQLPCTHSFHVICLKEWLRRVSRNISFFFFFSPERKMIGQG
jgi:hypothetical protein